MILAQAQVAQTHIQVDGDIDLQYVPDGGLVILDQGVLLALAEAVEEGPHSIQGCFVVLNGLFVVLLTGLAIAKLFLAIGHLELLLIGQNTWHHFSDVTS